MFDVIEKIFIGLLTSIVNASSHTKYTYFVIGNASSNPLLLIQILTNTVKEYLTNHLQLI